MGHQIRGKSGFSADQKSLDPYTFQVFVAEYGHRVYHINMLEGAQQQQMAEASCRVGISFDIYVELFYFEVIEFLQTRIGRP